MIWTFRRWQRYSFKTCPKQLWNKQTMFPLFLFSEPPICYHSNCIQNDLLYIMGWPFCHPKNKRLKWFQGDSEILGLVDTLQKYIYIYTFNIYIYTIPVTHFPDWFQPQTKHLTRKQTLQHRHLRPGNPTGKTGVATPTLKHTAVLRRKKRFNVESLTKLFVLDWKNPLLWAFLWAFLRSFIFQKKKLYKKKQIPLLFSEGLLLWVFLSDLFFSPREDQKGQWKVQGMMTPQEETT